MFGNTSGVSRLWTILVLWWKYRGLDYVVCWLWCGWVGHQQSLILSKIGSVTILFESSPCYQQYLLYTSYMSDPARHSPWKGRFRGQVINLAPLRRVRACRDGSLKLKEYVSVSPETSMLGFSGTLVSQPQLSNH